MLLSYTEICELIERGVIENASYDDVNSSSLDIHLGSKILVEKAHPITERPLMLNYKHRDAMAVMPYTIQAPFVLMPGQFILGHSVEVFNLPNEVSAEYKLKSSMARVGIEHLNAGWCDAGWNGSVLTLEIKNMTQYHAHMLHAGDAIGQIVFFRHTPVPEDRSYAARGRYNQDKTVETIKK